MIASGQDLLESILAATRRVVEARRGREPLQSVASRAERAAPRGDQFEARLSRPDGINVIAECKRRSPSKGVLAPEYDPVALARAYARGGAAAISVLTEPTFFDGALDHLVAVRAAVSEPLLRKDFVVDEYQLFEARAAGADAVLLIVAALDQSSLERLHVRARDLALAALVEVHDEHELRRAVDAGARVIGVNNRNLRTLAVDVDASHRLAAQVPQGVVAVSESGLQSRVELLSLSSAGYDAFLMGERLMLDPDPARALAHLIAGEADSAPEAAP